MKPKWRLLKIEQAGRTTYEIQERYMYFWYVSYWTYEEEEHARLRFKEVSNPFYKETILEEA